MRERLRAARVMRGKPPLRRDENGGALVEFAILTPVFFLLMFGAIEFGSLFFLQNAMVSAARETARTVSVQNIAPAKANICPWLASPGLTFTITYTDQCMAVQDVTATVTTDGAKASLVNYLGMFTGTILSTSVTMRKEQDCTAAGGPPVVFTCP